jgi:hypothetical protein
LNGIRRRFREIFIKIDLLMSGKIDLISTGPLWLNEVKYADIVQPRSFAGVGLPTPGIMKRKNKGSVSKIFCSEKRNEPLEIQ